MSPTHENDSEPEALDPPKIVAGPSSEPPELEYRDANDDQAHFLREAQAVRPSLHRYCTRMLGSVLDGEDVVQDTLAVAYFRLADVDRSRPLAPLLFRIAHNRCVDWLRRRRFEAADVPVDQAFEESLGADAESRTIVDQEALFAMRHLLTRLPVRQRACFLLADVLDHSMAEVADILGCTVGAAKAALGRARRSLATLRQGDLEPLSPPDPAEEGRVRAVLEQWVQCFNAMDWEGLAALLAEDVRLDVVGVLEDGTADTILTRYTGNYSALDGKWRLALGRIDGEQVLLCLRREPGAAAERTAWPIRVEIEQGRVRRLRDYVIQSALLEDADLERL